MGAKDRDCNVCECTCNLQKPHGEAMCVIAIDEQEIVPTLAG